MALNESKVFYKASFHNLLALLTFTPKTGPIFGEQTMLE